MSFREIDDALWESILKEELDKPKGTKDAWRKKKWWKF